MAAGVSLYIQQVDTFNGKLYAKTPGGWVLLQDERKEYIEAPNCVICLESTDAIFGSEGAKTEMKCCKNWVHDACLEAMVQAGHSGKMIGFNHVKCPSCRKSLVDQPANQLGFGGNLYRLLNEERQLYLQIKRMKESKNKGLSKEEQENWAFFKCMECTHPFCGGKVSCAEEFDLDPSSMVCDGCDWAKEAEDHRCFEHGKDYAIFKCDFCCSPACWACGSQHYCNYCHDHGGYQHPTPCLGPDKCPLGIPHPPPITTNERNRYVLSFVIGCHKCSDPNAKVEYKSYNADPFATTHKYTNMVVKFKYSKFNFQWNKAIDLQGGHLFDDEYEYETDSEDALEDKKIDEKNGVKDLSDIDDGEDAPNAKLGDEILLHAPLLPPPMVAQSS